MLSSPQTVLGALWLGMAGPLVQEAERFACHGAVLGCERWGGQDAACKGHSSQLQFNYTSMLEQPVNFQPQTLPCLQLGDQVG